MSTRSIIARQKGDGWEGRYCHYDGYPSGVGATIHRLYQEHFGRDAEAMLRVLIDEHPGGWCAIDDTDFSITPGYINRPSEGNRKQPQCFCHGDRHEMSPLLTSCGWDIEWLYIIQATPDGDIMRVLTGGEEPRSVAIVDLNRPAPDWDALKARVRA